MSPHAATLDEALIALQFFTGWAGGWVPFERRREGAVRSFWRPSMAPGLPDLIRGLDGSYEDEIAFGLPQVKRWHGGVGHGTALWARIETGEAYRRALAFRPLPSVVLREGSSLRRLLIWGLEETVPYFDLVAANKRLAYRFGSKQVDGDPDRLRIPCPGSSIRSAKRPVPVVVARLATDTFTSRAVVGGLVDPPATDWWESKGRRFQ